MPFGRALAKGLAEGLPAISKMLFLEKLRDSKLDKEYERQKQIQEERAKKISQFIPYITESGTVDIKSVPSTLLADKDILESYPTIAKMVSGAGFRGASSFDLGTRIKYQDYNKALDILTNQQFHTPEEIQWADYTYNKIKNEKFPALEQTTINTSPLESVIDKMRKELGINKKNNYNTVWEKVKKSLGLGYW